MALITARFPVVEVDGLLVAVAIGSATAEFGDTATLTAAYDRRRFENLTVLGVDTLPADEVIEEVLDLFDLKTPSDFVDALSRVYGTGLPTHVPVTIYTFSDRPIEEYDEDDLEWEIEGEAY